ncbi:hypothetical protein [Kiloniella sp. EL199]|uniref:hypothetical protein n=1 Tax=Kiloniella sp. EL199 TaxID=2107581 RepID=UPI0013C458AE|nr:hypothetical protein [Kiloniella sp. EL199]
MSKIVLSLSGVSLLVLAACQTTGNKEYWSDWESIPHHEAMLEWEPSKPTELFARKLSYNGAYQEHWEWKNGSLFVETAGHAYHFREETSPQKFGTFMEGWNAFKESGKKISASDVRTVRNKYGKFYYADVKNDANQECWTFLQSIPEKTVAGFIETGKPSGYLSGYECGANRPSENEIMDFSKSFSFS